MAKLWEICAPTGLPVKQSSPLLCVRLCVCAESQRDIMQHTIMYHFQFQ